MATAKSGTRQDAVNRSAPAMSRAKVGDVIEDLRNQVNTLTAKHNALLAKLDADAGVTDTNYASTLAAPSADVESMETRR